MLANKKPFLTLLLMISFASVNAVLFTPALPNITQFFNISTSTAQQTITWFLVGYTLGQLIYGPLANRFGRKPALYLGISLQIVSSLLCSIAGQENYLLLLIGRFLLALGSGVGLKMTFTLVNECYESPSANQKISYLILAFAITPGLAISLGGFLNDCWGWQSCFYASAVYGLILLLLCFRLPETKLQLDFNAFKIKHLFHEYFSQFKNGQLILGGVLMGCASSFIYIFSALAPFIAMNILGMKSTEYGIANILPSIGLCMGSILSAQFAKRYSQLTGVKFGILVTLISILFMFAMIMILQQLPWFKIFIPISFCYLGLAFIFPNASTLAMHQVLNKANGSAVMNFINMGLVTLIVLNLNYFVITEHLLSWIYLIICMAMIMLVQIIQNKMKESINI